LFAQRQSVRRIDNNSSLQNWGEVVELDVGFRGHVYALSQVADYVHRGEGLGKYNVLDVFVNTYEEYNQPRRTATTAIHPERDDTAQWKANHVPYLPHYHKSPHRGRTIRQDEHQNLPNLSVNIFLSAMIRKHTICIAHHSSCF
jgi:hypothetical protein